MGLSLLKYIEEFRPHLPWCFGVDFQDYPELNYCVKSIQQPQIPIDADTGRKRFGTTEYCIPIYSFGEQTLTVELEETAKLDVMKAIHNMCPGMEDVPGQTVITVTEYDTTMTTEIAKKQYTVRLKSYNNPEYAYGGSPSLIEISLEFIVDDEKDLLAENNEETKDASVTGPSVSQKTNKIDDRLMSFYGKEFDVGLDYAATVSAVSAAQEAEKKLAAEKFKKYEDSLKASTSAQDEMNKVEADKKAEEDKKKYDEAQKKKQQEEVLKGTKPSAASDTTGILNGDTNYVNKKGKTKDAGLMSGTVDLAEMYSYAKSKGYDLTKMSEVQRFMTTEHVLSSGSISQCTRGTAMTHQLLDYARDIEAGKDRSNSHMYQSSCKATDYDMTTGNTGNKDAGMTDSLKNEFTKDTSLSEKSMSTAELNTLGANKLKNSGDYISYKVKKPDGSESWHIVSLYIDKDNKRHYYSDFEQKKINVYAAGSTITDVNVYNYTGK